MQRLCVAVIVQGAQRSIWAPVVLLVLWESCVGPDVYRHELAVLLQRHVQFAGQQVFC